MTRILLAFITCLISLLFLTACGTSTVVSNPASTATAAPSQTVTPIAAATTPVTTTTKPPTTPPNPATPTKSIVTALPPTPASVDINLNAPFELKKGDKKYILNENLKLEYTSVKDSRCPANVVCAWSGIVDVEFQVSIQNQLSPLTLSLYGGSGVGLDPTNAPRPTPRSDDKNTKVLNGYSFRLLAVDPYPGLEKTNPPVYTIIMVINRA